MAVSYKIEEVNSDTFQPMKGMCFLDVKEGSKTKMVSGEFEFLLRTDYDPYATHSCVQNGVITHLPADLPELYKELKVGDMVYTTHHLINEKNAILLNGRKLRSMHYEDIYVIDRGGELISVGKWSLLEPAYEDDSQWKTASGLMLKAAPAKLKRHGIAFTCSPQLKEDGVQKGDMLNLRKNSEYEIEINGKLYYNVHDNDVLAIIEKTID